MRTGALFLLSSVYASHGCHQTMWDIHAQATAGWFWWSDGWAGCLSWFHACHDLGFLLSVWGLLLSMFLKLQVQGQMKRQLNLRQIDWTTPHLINILYLLLCVFKGQMAWYVVYRGRVSGVYGVISSIHQHVTNTQRIPMMVFILDYNRLQVLQVQGLSKAYYNPNTLQLTRQEVPDTMYLVLWTYYLYIWVRREVQLCLA